MRMLDFEPMYAFYADIYYKVYNGGNCESARKLVTKLMRLYRIVHRGIDPLFVNGNKMYIHLNDPGISTELILFKMHEPISTQVLTRFIKRGYHCLDVGANLGYYALLTAGLVGKEGRVVAAEPHPDNFNKLIVNVSTNKLDNMLCFNVACSNYDGVGVMQTTPQSNWHRVMSNNGSGGLPVELRKVDTLAKNFEKLNFMRMDVEGHEYEVIEGARETIERFGPYLFIEFHPSLVGKQRTLDLLEKLKGYGYEIEYFIPRCLDWPIVGKLSHVKKLGIEEYMAKIENNDPIDGREANAFLKI